MAAHIAYIGLGSNIKPRGLNILHALHRINQIDGTRITGLSNLYETAPVEADTQSYFVNGVARIETVLEPKALLKRLQQIELAMGRKRPFIDRTIDLDILLFDDIQMDEPGITIPHPRMHLRLFVLVPLFDLAPDTLLPQQGKTIEVLVHELQKLTEGTQAIAPYMGDAISDIAKFQAEARIIGAY